MGGHAAHKEQQINNRKPNIRPVRPLPARTHHVPARAVNDWLVADVSRSRNHHLLTSVGRLCGSQPSVWYASHAAAREHFGQPNSSHAHEQVQDLDRPVRRAWQQLILRKAKGRNNQTPGDPERSHSGLLPGPRSQYGERSDGTSKIPSSM